MQRKEFLRNVGLTGIGLTLPLPNILADKTKLNGTLGGGCVLIPTETAGPFPLDLTANTFYFRQDVRESEPGVQMNLKMKIIGNSNCLPMQNVRVNIWHCNNVGDYSGYGSQTGLTYLRGYQITDANGEVEFITILPGWYPGRVCHIHFQVYVSTSYAAISQLTFDEATKNEIYLANPTLYPDGEDPVAITNDGIFSDGYTYQLATLTPNSTDGYDAYLEVTVEGEGSLNVGYLEMQNAKQFLLQQNNPNPFYNETIIPITLNQASKVKFDIWNLSGSKVATIDKRMMSTGYHQVVINLHELQLPHANYIYQVEVENSDGIFRNCKVMTAMK